MQGSERGTGSSFEEPWQHRQQQQHRQPNWKKLFASKKPKTSENPGSKKKEGKADKKKKPRERGGSVGQTCSEINCFYNFEIFSAFSFFLSMNQGEEVTLMNSGSQRGRGLLRLREEQLGPPVERQETVGQVVRAQGQRTEWERRV